MAFKKLKIALIADPELPVPPLLYGGIERIIDMLIEEYVRIGHDVTLFAHQDSKTKAILYPYPSETNTKFGVIKNAWLVNKTIFSHKFDIVHSFGRLIYLLPQLPLSLPKIMSYQREPTLSQIRKAMNLAKENSLAFTGCSGYISNQIAPYAPAYPIYNGVDLNKYAFTKEVEKDAPLVFLGRIEPIKGTHIAIEVAKRTGRNLIIAGNVPKEFTDYFKQEIEPNLTNTIKYIGPVNDIEKNKLLGSALAFLMPILWNEPFGIVMAELMACGTPVIGFNRGSVPEVVKDGVNGFACSDVDEMVALVQRIDEIKRSNVRQDAEARFSAQIIAQNYLSLYEDRIGKG